LARCLTLADPSEASFGDVWSPGRFHLATRETFLRLPDRSGREVQFVLVPYPTAGRFLDDAVTAFQGGIEGRNRLLRDLVRDKLGRMRAHPRFRTNLHSVLVAHLFLQGATLPGGYEVTAADEDKHVVCPPEDLGAGWAYVALGDIHKPQALGGRPHVRYSGSIERLNADERGDEKGVVLLDIGPEGLRGEPSWVPLEATPFLDVEINRPAEDLPGLEARYPDAARALVRCRVTYTAGVDDRDEVARRLAEVFPRLYKLEMAESGRLAAGPAGGSSGGSSRRGVRETVIEYLTGELSKKGHPDPGAVLAAADELLAEVNR
jgi:exonuclease SbcD